MPYPLKLLESVTPRFARLDDNPELMDEFLNFRDNRRSQQRAAAKAGTSEGHFRLDYVKGQNPDAWAILLDTRGYLCEGIGSNIFTVKEGTLYTPKSQYVLAGVTRETVLELAAECGIPAVEADLSPYDGCTADEAFITSTSFCVCPVRSINGVTLGDGTVPGPVTKVLTDAFIALVDYDFVAQYTRHLS